MLNTFQAISFPKFIIRLHFGSSGQCYFENNFRIAPNAVSNGSTARRTILLRQRTLKFFLDPDILISTKITITYNLLLFYGGIFLLKILIYFFGYEPKSLI